MIKRLFSIGCLVASAVLLYFAYTNLTESFPKNKAEKVLKKDSTKINLSFFGDHIDANNITAIGVKAQRTCTSCISEFMDYSALIDTLDSAFYDSQKIDKYFVIVGNDSASAFRFRKIFDLPNNVFFVNIHSLMGQILFTWKKGAYRNQWIFVNNRSSTITGRILILNRTTSANYKRELLNKALFAGKEQQTNLNP
jgi:hypothetical protein